MKLPWIDRGTNLEKVVVGVVACLIVVALFFAIQAAREHSRWTEWCAAQGGHVDSSTSTGTAISYDSNGKPVVGTTTSTSYYCLTNDGRILDVR